MHHRLTSFTFEGQVLPVRFVESMAVKKGVTCDVYTFDNDDTKDLGIVRVKKGHKTPLQKVLLGERTIEVFMSGKGSLVVTSRESGATTYDFGPESANSEVVVRVGETMQWRADEDLVFYEICEPPYQDGRFENLPE